MIYREIIISITSSPLDLENQHDMSTTVAHTFKLSRPTQSPNNILRGEFSLFTPSNVASLCRIPDERGVALLPIRPCFAGDLYVVFNIDEIEPSADRLGGDGWTILNVFYRYNECLRRIAFMRGERCESVGCESE